jgi:hypothetical protein
MAEPKKPKTVPEADYPSALGPVPPEHFDDDLPYRPNPDKSPGSTYDRLSKRIERDEKERDEKK